MHRSIRIELFTARFRWLLKWQSNIPRQQINRSEEVYPSPFNCLRYALCSVKCSGYIRAHTAHHSPIVIGCNLLCAELRTVLSLAPEQSVVRRIHQELSRRPRYSASDKDPYAYSVVAHDWLHHTAYRIRLVGAIYIVGGCGGGYHSFGQDKDLQTRPRLRVPSHLKSKGKTMDSLTGSTLEIADDG